MENAKTSLLEFDQFNSPEVILGFIFVIVLFIVLILGFLYKRHQSRK